MDEDTFSAIDPSGPPIFDRLNRLHNIKEDDKRRTIAEPKVEAKAGEDAHPADAAPRPRAASAAITTTKDHHLPQSGFKIVGKDGRCDFVPRFRSASKPTQPRPKPCKNAAPASAAISGSPASSPAKAPSAVPRLANSDHRRVKIVGRNGEKAYVEVPVICVGSNPASKLYVPVAAAQSAKAGRAVGGPAITDKEERGDEQRTKTAWKAALDKNAAEAAKELRAQRERQVREEKAARGSQAKAAAEVLMSGGLGEPGIPSPADNPASQPPSRHDNTRSPSVLNGVMDWVSREPSKASDRTAATKPAQAANVGVASQIGNHRTKSVFVSVGQRLPSDRQSAQKTASPAMWEEVGSGNLDSQQPISAGAHQHTEGQVSAQDAAYPGAWQATGSYGVSARAPHVPHDRPQASQHVVKSRTAREGGHSWFASRAPGQQRKAPTQLRWHQAISTESASRLPTQQSNPATHQSQAADQPDWQDLGTAVLYPSTPAAGHFWEGEDARHRTPSPASQRSFSQNHQPPIRRKKAETPPSHPTYVPSPPVSEKIAGIHQWNDATTSRQSAIPTVTGTSPTRPTALNAQLANNASQDTIYAGTGWVSPHPLSSASAQSEISYQGATMTYEQYKRLQEQTGSMLGGEGGSHRESIARAGGGAAFPVRGTWLQSLSKRPPSLGGNAPDSGVWSERRSEDITPATTYRTPTVVTDRSRYRKAWSSHGRGVRSSATPGLAEGLDDTPLRVSAGGAAHGGGLDPFWEGVSEGRGGEGGSEERTWTELGGRRGESGWSTGLTDNWK